MLFKSLPNPRDRILLSRYLWEDETLVVHDRARDVSYRRHAAPLSLKAVLSGAESYNVHGFDEVIQPGECLIINEGQVYSSAIDSALEAETLCVFFSLNDVLSVAETGVLEGTHLDNAIARSDIPEFPAVKRKMSAELQQRLAALLKHRHAPKLRQEEFSLALLASVLALEQKYRRSQHITALRASTRDELYRRCSVAHSFLKSHLADDLSLIDLARVAGLSRAHFLRAFSQCFGETPYQALRKERLNRAAALLQSGRRPVSQIAVSVGYSDLSAFARAFRSFHGTSPSALSK